MGRRGRETTRHRLVGPEPAKEASYAGSVKGTKRLTRARVVPSDGVVFWRANCWSTAAPGRQRSDSGIVTASAKKGEGALGMATTHAEVRPSSRVQLDRPTWYRSKEPKLTRLDSLRSRRCGGQQRRGQAVLWKSCTVSQTRRTRLASGWRHQLTVGLCRDQHSLPPRKQLAQEASLKKGASQELPP